MKKQFLFLAMCIVAILSTNAQTSVWDGSHTVWTKGTGAQADPYLIENAAQLAHLAYVVNNGIDAVSIDDTKLVGKDTYWKLMTDIDLNSRQWAPIGGLFDYSLMSFCVFGGNFDGNNHTIANLYINSTTLIFAGLFGYIYGGSIKNVGIISGSIMAKESMAGIVGGAGDTTIDNCYNKVSISSNRSGGIVGHASSVTISNCYNTGSISSSFSGGIVGYTDSSSTLTINNCYNTGKISSSSISGGIVGYVDSSFAVTINNCYNTGNISSDYFSGGIVGCINNSGTIINNCYNTGILSGVTKGGIVGYEYGNEGAVNNSYYLVTCGGDNTYGGESKTEIYMKNTEFVSLLNSGTNATFAFCQDVVPFVNNGYPVLNNNGFEIQTLAVANINRDNATLKGSIKQGTVTLSSKGFQYKKATETDYTSVTVTSSNDALSYNLMGLQENTTYEYRTFAKNTSNEYAFGDVMNFTTTIFNTNSNGYYLIEDRADLILLANMVNGGNNFAGNTFVLKNDITLPISPNNILSIGNYQNNRPFSGTFHGNGKRIYNVYIDEPNTPYQGFFGYTKNAYLYEVGLVNITASGRNYTGGMVAYAENTRINDSYVSGGTLFALSYCGGLVGYQTPGTNSIITGCYNTCTVSGNNYVGGLLGYSNQGTVRNSYAAALVTGQGAGVGAIIGGAQDVLNYNCYFNEEITGQPFAIGENNIGMRASGEGNLSSGDMRMLAFVNTLNQGLVTPVWKTDYEEAINNGFPILMWQSNKNIGIDAETLRTTSLQIYPNPAKDYVFIQSELSLRKVEIYNSSGVCVWANNHPITQLDVSSLANGVYFVRIDTDRMPVTRKMLVEK